MSLYPDVEKQIDDLLGQKMKGEQATADTDGPKVEMVTRWVTVVETMADDGERHLTRLWSPALPRWDVYGLLTFGAYPTVWDDSDPSEGDD